MKWLINHFDHKKLTKAVCMAINNAFFNLEQSEPQLVANLVWELPKEINTLVFSGGLTLKSSSIFVHAQPLVECCSFPSSKTESVEIGDLLLLRAEARGGKITDRRAMLLQAKKTSGFPVKPDNPNQHHLYANWPPFTYVRSTNDLNGKQRHITGMDLYDASRYLLITDRYCRFSHCHSYRHINCCSACRVMTASPTQPKLSCYRDFLIEIVDFLLGNAGKVYSSNPPSGTIDWDTVINDLISVTASRKTTYISKASNQRSHTRGQALNVLFQSGIQPPEYGGLYSAWRDESSTFENSNGEPPQVPDEWLNDFDGNGGISIIEFNISIDD